MTARRVVTGGAERPALAIEDSPMRTHIGLGLRTHQSGAKMQMVRAKQAREKKQKSVHFGFDREISRAYIPRPRRP